MPNFNEIRAIAEPSSSSYIQTPKQYIKPIGREISHDIKDVAAAIVGSLAFSKGGVMLGGTIGSTIAPGIGTAIGAGAGGIIGTAIGSPLGEQAMRNVTKDPRGDLTENEVLWSAGLGAITHGAGVPIAKSLGKPVTNTISNIAKKIAQSPSISVNEAARLGKIAEIFAGKANPAATPIKEKITEELIENTPKGVAEKILSKIPKGLKGDINNAKKFVKKFVTDDVLETPENIARSAIGIQKQSLPQTAATIAELTAGGYAVRDRDGGWALKADGKEYLMPDLNIFSAIGGTKRQIENNQTLLKNIEYDYDTQKKINDLLYENKPVFGTASKEKREELIRDEIKRIKSKQYDNDLKSGALNSIKSANIGRVLPNIKNIVRFGFAPELINLAANASDIKDELKDKGAEEWAKERYLGRKDSDPKFIIEKVDRMTDNRKDILKKDIEKFDNQVEKFIYRYKEAMYNNASLKEKTDIYLDYRDFLHNEKNTKNITAEAYNKIIEKFKPQELEEEYYKRKSRASE